MVCLTAAAPSEKVSHALEYEMAITGEHGCRARAGHGLSKVFLGLAMPYPSTPYGWATPKTALRLFQGWPARRLGGLQPSSTLWTPHAVRLRITAEGGRIKGKRTS
jgi:hypothetical protein